MPLNNIIRQIPVAGRNASPPPGFSLYAVHTKKLTVTSKAPGMLGGLMGNGADDFKYYHVHSIGRDTLASQERPVTDDNGQRRRWRVHLGSIGGSSAPEQLVLAVAQVSNPEDAVWKIVNESIDASIHELGMSGESAVTKPSPVKFEFIKNAIAERLAAELGLTAAVTVRPALELKPVEHYKTDEFQVKLKDMRADDTLKLVLEVDVQSPLSQGEREALMAHLPDREDITLALQSATQSWLAQNSPLHHFCYSEDDIRSNLMSECGKVLPEGLTILSLSLQWMNRFKLDFPTEASREVVCKVRPNLTPMMIHHTLTLKLVDLGKWRKARVPNEDLAAWVAARVDAITGGVLSDETFVDVMIGFPAIRDKIKQQFAVEIDAIGFAATQHIAHTQHRDLEKILEARTFDVQTGDLEYATKSGTVPFGLRIAAKVRLDDLEKVKRFIEPNFDFRVPFVEALRDGASQAIRKLDPDSLYAAFHEDKAVDPHRAGGSRIYDMDDDNVRLPADELIKKHILGELAAYNANKSHIEGNGHRDIDLTFIPTSMDRVYSAMGPRSPKPLVLAIEALDPQGGETVTIDCTYTMEMAPKGWSRFHNQCHNQLNYLGVRSASGETAALETQAASALLEKIGTMLKQNAEAMLGRLPLDFFVMPGDGEMRMAEAVAFFGFSEDLEEAVQAGRMPRAESSSGACRVEEDFGLRVMNRGFNIQLTDTQKELRKQRVSTRTHFTTLLKERREQQQEAVRTLDPDDPMHVKHQAATEEAEKKAKEAVTENTAFAKERLSLLETSRRFSRTKNLADRSSGNDNPSTTP